MGPSKAHVAIKKIDGLWSLFPHMVKGWKQCMHSKGCLVVKRRVQRLAVDRYGTGAKAGQDFPSETTSSTAAPSACADTYWQSGLHLVSGLGQL